MTSPRDGNRVRLLQCGVEFFPALEQAIDAAVRDVWLETYIFADDDTGRRIAAALARAAQRGVAVHVVYDGFGSAAHIGALGAWLSSQGVEVAVFRAETTWNKLRRSRLRRLHRKLAMIDARVAFVGGINIIDDLNMPEPRHPRYDFAVAVEGPIMMPIHAAMAAKSGRNARGEGIVLSVMCLVRSQYCPYTPAPVDDNRTVPSETSRGRDWS